MKKKNIPPHHFTATVLYFYLAKRLTADLTGHVQEHLSRITFDYEIEQLRTFLRISYLPASLALPLSHECTRFLINNHSDPTKMSQKPDPLFIFGNWAIEALNSLELRQTSFDQAATDLLHGFLMADKGHLGPIPEGMAETPFSDGPEQEKEVLMKFLKTLMITQSYPSLANN